MFYIVQKYSASQTCGYKNFKFIIAEHLNYHMSFYDSILQYLNIVIEYMKL
jgi:hypothetical protein